MESKYEVLFKYIQEKWEKITGRSFHYAAPETSSTVSFVHILRDLEKRILSLEEENERCNICGDHLSACPDARPLETQDKRKPTLYQESGDCPDGCLGHLH